MAFASLIVLCRPFPLLGMNFPAVLDDEIPTFLTDVATSQHQPALDPSHSVYSLFIGTNDLGNNGFATDSQVPGTVLADYTSCIFTVLDKLYASGARYFLLLNTVPLHLLPQYANETLGSVNNTRFYPDKEANHTRVAQKMHQLTTSANEILKYQTPFELLVAGRYPGAHIALFDTYALFSDIYHAPELYLNGTEKANVRGWIEHCDLDFENCVKEFDGKSDDSFMWFDELHPSEQVHRVLGQEVVETLKGRGAYATYWSS